MPESYSKHSMLMFGHSSAPKLKAKQRRNSKAAIKAKAYGHMCEYTHGSLAQPIKAAACGGPKS